MCVFKDYHITDVVSESDLKANVEFSTISLAPTVEVLLYAVPPEVKLFISLFSYVYVLLFLFQDRDMCIDSVVVTLMSSPMRDDHYNGSIY